MTECKYTLIALCGFKGCGKDFVAKYIHDTYMFEHLKISTKLKEITKLLFELDDSHVEGNKKECIVDKWNITPRQMMQFLGTEMFQYKIQELLPSSGRYFWIQSFVHSMKNKKNIVVSDLRFLHEYDYMKKHLQTHNLIVIRIDNFMNNIYDTTDTHASEMEYTEIPIDFQVTNNMTGGIKTIIDTIIDKYDYPLL